MSSYQQQLLQTLRQQSLKTGDFILASGQRSPYYLDGRLTAMDAQGLWLLGQVLLEHVTQVCGNRLPDAIGGMAVGAVPLVSAVLMAAAQQGLPMKGFFVRKEAKGHGTGRQVEGHCQPWMRVVFLEDVVTTGGSTRQAIAAVQKEQPGITIAGVVSVVNRLSDPMANPFAPIAYQPVFQWAHVIG